MEYKVKFIEITQSTYDALVSKEQGSLYFTRDTKRIYKGDSLYATSSFDTVSAQTATFGNLIVTGDVSMSLS
jgi:hypothetical protein